MEESFKHVVIISDIQYPFHDRGAEAAVMDYIRRTRPDKMVIIGDFLDMYSLSRFKKRVPPQDRLYLDKEIEFGTKKLKEWAACEPGAEKYFIEGNHEARLNTYLETHAPELYGVKAMRFERLLEVEEAGWKYIAPYGAGMWLGKPGGIWATHGRYSSENAMKKNLHMKGCSVIYGHTHKVRSMAHTDNTRTIAAYEVGCLCNFKTTPKNVDDTDWQHGLASVWVSDRSRRFHVDLITINGGSFVTGGRRYGK